MQIFDIHNSSKSAVSLTNQSITSNESINGLIIDTVGFQALEFIFQVGPVVDGVYDIKIQEGNDPGLSDSADVSLEETLGFIKFTDSDSNTTDRFGYIGKKRFVRIVITSTGVTTGLNFISGIALLVNAHHQPTLNQ